MDLVIDVPVLGPRRQPCGGAAGTTLSRCSGMYTDRGSKQIML